MPAPRRSPHATRTRCGGSCPRRLRSKVEVTHAPGESPDDAGEPDEASSPAPVGWPGQAEVARSTPRQVDPGVAWVELDEVKVHAQAETGRKEILVFTALVMSAGRCGHLAAATTRDVT